MKDVNLKPYFRRISTWRGTGIGILTLIIVGVYARIAIFHQYDWIWSPDLVNQVYPWLEVQAAAFQRGVIPLWDPYLWGGQPLLGQVQPGGASPLNWLLFLLPTRDGFIRYGFLDWYFVAIHVLAASFAYLLCRQLGTSRPAAVLGGALFSLGGFLGRSDWPQMMNSAIWTPLVFLAIFRAPLSPRIWTVSSLGGLALGMAWLAGHHQVPIFLTIAAGLLWTFQATREGILRTRIVAAAGLFFVCTGLVAAVQILPSLEYGREAVRWIGLDQPADWQDKVPYFLHERYAERPFRIFGWVIPNIFDHYDHFLGFTGLSLALIGISATWRRWETRLLLGVAVLSVFLSFGGYTLFHGLLYAFVPLFEKARTPAAFSGLFSAAMAAVAAVGLDAVRSRSGGKAMGVAKKALIASAILLLALAAWLLYANQMSFPTDDRFVLSALVALLFGGLLFVRERDELGTTALTILVVGLALVELSLSALLPFPARLDPARPGAFVKRYEFTDVAQFLREQSGYQRAHVRQSDIPIAFGDLYQIPVFEGYTASVPATVYDLGMAQRKSLALYGVSTFISKEPLYEGQAHIRDFSSGVKAWRMDGAYPRTWISHAAVSFPSVAAFRGNFDQGAFDSREVAPFVGEAPALPACDPSVSAGDRAQIESYSMNAVTIRAKSDCDGLLILSDNAFPGWEATVDGKALPIVRPFHALRGVVLPPGEHLVQMEYRPTSAILGAALSCLGLLLVGGVSLFEWRRNRNSSGSPLAQNRAYTVTSSGDGVGTSARPGATSHSAPPAST